MTVVASWLNKAENSIWTVTDSRLTTSSEMGAVFDYGAKLFSLRINCLKPDKTGLFRDIYHTRTIGFAFAGSSLIALNFHALLSQLLGNLKSINSNNIPSMADIAQYGHDLLDFIIREYAVSAKEPPPCEVSFIGYCPIERNFEIYHITPEINPIFELKLNKIDFKYDGFVHFMGDHKKEINEEVTTMRSNISEKNSEWWRLPKKVIENIIRLKKYNTIGGYLQLGIANEYGFENYSLCRPIIPGRPQATLYYQNIDICDPKFSKVGNCIVNIIGMA